MLEDDFTYVFRKALAGHGIAPAEAAARAGLTESETLTFLRGTFSPETARKLAAPLGLNAAAFAKHDSYSPAPLTLPGIHRLELPFGEDLVNAWLVRDGGSAVLFDTGNGANDAANALLPITGRMPERVFVTHAHRDHVAGIPRFLTEGLPVHAAGIGQTIPMKPGDIVFCGNLIVRACDLSGHASPALGFNIEGLSKPVFVTGDALFAGSIGGCGSPAIYQNALRTLRQALAPLPDETVLLPGHGPATTLGEERVSNPFL
jgi:glyoxylase-like metal-dependent hydrolase (beta-lactamase superfamily II)